MCGSGLRWQRSAGDGLAGACVGDAPDLGVADAAADLAPADAGADLADAAAEDLVVVDLTMVDLGPCGANGERCCQVFPYCKAGLACLTVSDDAGTRKECHVP